MKPRGNFLIIALSGLILFISHLPCSAEEQKENIWADEPEFKHRELTPERVERIISRLAEQDPEKAKELAKLQQEDPGKFTAELREIIHHQFDERRKKHMKGGGGNGSKHPGPEHPWRDRAIQMRQKHNEYLEWLQGNYPDEANSLAEIKDEKPELYMKKLQHSLRKYGQIIRASKENPQLAEILKKDLLLKEKRNDLLKEIRTTTDEKKTKALAKELETVISSRFDLIVERKQAEYEQLNRRLERLKEQVEKSQAQIEKWKDSKFKGESLKSRLDKLITKAEQFTWD